MTSIRIRGIDHVVLRVADLERSLRFYCGVLGCQQERRLDELGLVQLRAGSGLIDLVPAESPLGKAGGAAPPGPERGGRAVDHFALQIESFDFNELRAELRAAGVEPGEVAERYGAEGMGPSLYLRDPDGNTVELKGPGTGRKP